MVPRTLPFRALRKTHRVSARRGMASPSQGSRAASAPCHACLLRGDERKGPNARASWRRICDDCAEDYMTPLLVPMERVRMCPESFGTWGQSREIFQLSLIHI